MMRTAFVLGIAATFAAGSAFAQGGEKKTGSKSSISKSAMADTLMTAEKTMLDNLTKHDAAAFFGVIAPGAWSIDEGGLMKIEDFKKDWNQIKVESSTTSDMRVVPIDATSGIVTYRLEQKGTYNGQPFPPNVYASTVWVNKSGKWMAVFHQESTAAPKK
jgi:hypothetical protein